MRQEDPLAVGDIHRRARKVESTYGVLLSLAGLALMVWLPTERESIRLVVGFLLILLGGMMISQDVVRDWFGLFGDLLPFGKKGGQ